MSDTSGTQRAENRASFTILITGSVSREGDFHDALDNILHQEFVDRIWDQVADREFASLRFQMESSGKGVPEVSYPPAVDVPAPEITVEPVE